MEVLVVPAEPEEPDGPEVVRKTASQPDERHRLLREAEVLRAAAERGVGGLPEVLAAPSAEGADLCLVTAAVAGPSLAVAAPLPVIEVAGVAAEVARLLAGLHEVGLVHGAVAPGHVVLDGAGGLILVGLGNGGPVGASSPAVAGGALDPAGDVASWGALVSHLLDWSATGDDESLIVLRRSLAERRPGRSKGRQRPSTVGEHERRVLAALADQAQDPDPARRPSARSLATAIGHRLPDARVPGAVSAAATGQATGLLDRLAAHVVTSGGAPVVDATASATTGPVAPRDAPPARRRRRRRPAVPRGPGSPAGANPSQDPAGEPDSGPTLEATTGRGSPARRRRGSAIGGTAPTAPSPVPAGARRAQHDGGTNPGGSTPGVGEAAPAPKSSGRLTGARRWVAVAAGGSALGVLFLLAAGRPARSPHAAPPAGCAPAAAPAADVDGDGCEEAVAWTDGILQAGSARFALGARGDAWAIGDWDCDGRRTPALLHQGALAVFDTWPGPGAELQGRVVATAAGATGLTVVSGPDGCDRPCLVGPNAGARTVEARKAP